MPVDHDTEARVLLKKIEYNKRNPGTTAPTSTANLGNLFPNGHHQSKILELSQKIRSKGIFRANKGQAVIEAIFALVIFAILLVALLPIYYQLLNSYLIPDVQGQAFGSIAVLIFQVAPIVLFIGIIWALVSYFRPQVSRLE